MRYKSSIKKSDIVNIKVQCTSASGATVKEELPKHSGEDSMEHYLMCMKHFDTVAKRYNWWATGPVVQANVDLAFETMSRILSDEPLETWEDECAVRATKNKANFDKNSDILTKFVCGEDAYDAQVNHLKYTKKPEDMTMSQWLKRIEAINRMLPRLKPSGKQLTIEELNKYVISENIPGKMAVSYIGQGGKRFTKKDEIKTMLEELEEAHELNKKLDASRENKRSRFQKKGDVFFELSERSHNAKN